MRPVARLALACTALAYAALASGCATKAPEPGPNAPGTASDAGRTGPGTLPLERLGADTRWSGEVELDRVLYVPAGVRLEIAPGTHVRMVDVDRDRNGIGDAGIYCRGTIVAEGTPEAPIVFEPADGEVRADRWGEVKVEHSRGNVFRNVRFLGAHWALHAHFSELDLEGSVLRAGEGGVRFRGGRIRIAENRFEENRIGIRFWYSEPEIVANAFVGNDTGVFLREGVRDFPFHDNTFASRRYHVQLGEAQITPIAAAGNYWSSTDPAEIRAHLFDRGMEPRLGEIRFEPFLDAPPGGVPRPSRRADAS